MNVDQYFSERSNLIARVLHEHPFTRDWRTYAVGAACLIAALGTEIWAAHALMDPGFFARTSTFLTFVLGAGVWLLTVAFTADVLIARTAVPAREAVVGQTLNQLIKVDGSLAHKLLAQQNS